VFSTQAIVRVPITRDSAGLLDRIATMRPRLLAVARSMRAMEPEDLVQSTIEIAIRHANELRDDERLWPWLVAIQTREMFRLARRVRLLGRSVDRDDASVDVVTFVDLRHALGDLPPRMRASIILHHMADLSVAQTADALGTTENTVKTQLRIGLRRLKEALT
jgi:RNA polymerase sigma factor (sigma-70 family)